SRNEGQRARLDHELLRGDLQERGLDPLPELDLAGEHGDRSVRIHAYPGVEQRRRLEAARQCGHWLRLACVWRFRCRRLPTKREADDQRAARGKKIAPGNVAPRALAHVFGSLFPLAVMSRLARSTALTMRMWLPQRHRLGLMWRRISCRLGAGLRSSRACARMIMPGMQ